ncbi:MAG: hypothetical protein Kow0081_1270 [Candidatus Dojkabacteria bacterium]
MKEFAFKLIAVIAILFLSTAAIIPSLPVRGEDTPEEQLRKIEEELKRIQDEKAKIQEQIESNSYVIEGYSAQASKLYAEVQVFQKDIDELNLQVIQLELAIGVLEENIDANIKEIEKTEKAIADLESETDSRIKGSYKEFRINANGSINGSNIFNSESINKFFKDSQYIEIIQGDTNELLVEIAQLKDQLHESKAELEQQLLQIEKEKAEIEVKRSDLDKRKAELEVRMNQYYAEMNKLRNEINNANNAIAAFSKEEIEKKSLQEQLYQQIFNSFSPPTNGEFVAVGRPIGNQGCTGLCTGPHLHFSVQVNGAFQDPCGYLKPGPVAGCGWGDRLEWPIRGTFYYTSAFGNRCFLWGGSNYCDFHTGADFASPTAGAPIYAAHDGYLYRGVDPYGANYVIICENGNCNQGLKTGYWHLQ